MLHIVKTQLDLDLDPSLPAFHLSSYLNLSDEANANLLQRICRVEGKSAEQAGALLTRQATVQ